jgi:hypothetical protein
MRKAGIAHVLIATLGLIALPGRGAEPRPAPELPITPKPAAPIEIRYELEGTPSVGNAIDIALTIAAGEAFTNGVLALNAADPLALIDPVGPMALDSLAAGESRNLTITVLPLASQTQYLHVNVTADIRGQRQTRVVDVPIRLPGTQPVKAKTNPAAKPEEAVHSFQAIETYR